MMQRYRYLLPLLIFIGLLVFLWRGLSLHPHLLPSPLINKPVPIFSLPALAPSSPPLTTADFKGQLSLLNVWASWCVSCQLEHPILMDIARHHAIRIYGLDYKDNRSAAMAFLTQYGNPYHAIGFDATGDTAINLGVYGTPETFIIDSHGVIRYKHIGPITSDVWQEVLLPEIIRLQKKAQRK